MSLANRFKNLYRGQLFIFCLFFFYLKISLLEMLIAVGNEHLKNKKMEKNHLWQRLGQDEDKEELGEEDDEVT